MEPFTAHHLRFEVQARTPLLLPAYPGAAIRGALFDALRHHFCPAASPGAAEPSAEHKAACPVCWLMATENPDRGRGRDVPRPYTVEPPGEGREEREARRLDPGQRVSFGLTLFSQAMNLFPYLVVAMPLMGGSGLGIPLAGENGARPQRGRFDLCTIRAIHPFSGQIACVLDEGDPTVRVPDLPATDDDAAEAAAALLRRLPEDGLLTLCFDTPTRIVEAKRLVQRPWMGPLVRRLLERLDALRGEYAGQPPTADRERLSALADRVRLVEDRTRWVDLSSHSRRLGRGTPIGGYVGTASYHADREAWQALLPHLLWGQVTHVGKNATKGDGRYRVRAAEGR